MEILPANLLVFGVTHYRGGGGARYDGQMNFRPVDHSLPRVGGALVADILFHFQLFR